MQAACISAKSQELDAPAVVDVGSGKGYLSSLLALECGKRVVAIEGVPSYSDAAAKRLDGIVNDRKSAAGNTDNDKGKSGEGESGGSSSNSRSAGNSSGRGKDDVINSGDGTPMKSSSRGGVTFRDVQESAKMKLENPLFLTVRLASRSTDSKSSVHTTKSNTPASIIGIPDLSTGTATTSSSTGTSTTERNRKVYKMPVRTLLSRVPWKNAIRQAKDHDLIHECHRN